MFENTTQFLHFSFPSIRLEPNGFTMETMTTRGLSLKIKAPNISNITWKVTVHYNSFAAKTIIQEAWIKNTSKIVPHHPTVTWSNLLFSISNHNLSLFAETDTAFYPSSVNGERRSCEPRTQKSVVVAFDKVVLKIYQNGLSNSRSSVTIDIELFLAIKSKENRYNFIK